jgi:hypothetical protein
MLSVVGFTAPHIDYHALAPEIIVATTLLVVLLVDLASERNRALLGTISGMIKSFGSDGGNEGGNQATVLAEGISEVLNCTAFAIATSLVGLLGFSLIQGKTTSVTDDINEVTVQVVNLVTSHRAQMQPTG